LFLICDNVKFKTDSSCVYENDKTQHNTHLTAIFQDNLGKSVPECLHSGFYWSKDDEGGDDKCSYKTCKPPVKSSPPTKQHPTSHRPDALPVSQLTVSRH